MAYIILANFYEMPGDIGYSQLQIRNNPKTKRKVLAWMTGANLNILSYWSKTDLFKQKHFVKGAGILTYELDLTSLARFSSANSQNDSTRRLISESNHDIIRYASMITKLAENITGFAVICTFLLVIHSQKTTVT